MTHGQQLVADIELVVEPGIAVARIAGVDRFATGTAATSYGFRARHVPVSVVYITNGLNYPDALAAGPAAIHKGGALLTVTPTEIPAVVAAELTRLDPDKVIIVGGPSSVGPAVEVNLDGMFGSANVTRIHGADRFLTSLALAREAFEDPDAVFIATGNNFPDALAAGPAAAQADAPILLVNGTAAALDASTVHLLESYDPSRVFVLGSSAAVSSGILSHIHEITGVHPERLEGPNRYFTALDIVERFFEQSELAFVATGVNFPDALGGGALAGRLGAPLYLTPPNCLDPYVLNDIFYIGTREVKLLGSSATLSDNVASGVPCSP